MGRFPNKNRHSARGSQGKNNKQPTNKHVIAKKKLEDYYFSVGSSKQASDFESAYEFILNHIKKTYTRGNDISETLRTLEEPNTDDWKPTLIISKSTDTDEKQRENRQFELEYRAEYDEYMRRKREYTQNCFSAYALLWERCNKAMKAKIEARKDYESTIYNKPIKLIEAIKEHALNYEENRYEMSIILDSLLSFLLCKQKEKESLQDYTKRYKVARDVLRGHLGGNIELHKFVKSMEGYDESDEEKTTELLSKADEQFVTYVYLVNSDQGKYGSVLKGLHTQKALNNDQYPKKLVEGNNVLSTHRFDNSKENKQEKHPKKNEKYEKSERKRENANNESENKDEPVVLSFAQMEGNCYCCGKTGHKSPQCWMREKTPREEWAINKTQLAHNKIESENSNKESNPPQSVTETKEEQHIGWAGVHIALTQDNDREEQDLKKLILLDSDSNTTVFCEKKYVEEIWDVEDTMGLGTNGGGSLLSKKKCNIPYLGEHWFNEDSITNIIAMKDMTDRYRVTMDSAVEKALFVHLPHKVVIFKQLKNNLYGMDPSDPNSSITTEEYQEKNIQLTNIVTDNLKYMSERQRKRAKAARKVFQAVGTPTTQDLKSIIRMNLIKNMEITTEDVNLAKKAFGPDVGSMKGKSTRKSPIPALSNVIEIPTELLSLNEDITLSIDGLNVNTLKFLTSISHDVYYRAGQYLIDATAKEYEKLMYELYYLYRKSGFTIVEIHCDNEFRKALDTFCAKQTPPININYASANEHVPRAERNNRTIQERVRCNYYQLPYVHLPRIIVKYLVSESAKKLNFFPNKNGVSKYYSPRMILHKENLDFNKHCKYVLGEYVQAFEDDSIKNNNKPRTLDCLYLRSSNNHQGGYELLHLSTNRVITRHSIKTVPSTPSVIKQVHALAAMDKMPQGLKINTRSNVTLFDASWIAGVDYSENAFEEEEDDSEYDEESYEEENLIENSSATEEMEEYDEIDENELADILEDQYKITSDNEQEEEMAEENEIEDNEDHEELEVEEEIPEEDETKDEEYEPGNNNADNEATNPEPRRSTRRREVPIRTGIFYSHLHDLSNKKQEYSEESARILAYVMCHYSIIGKGNKAMSKKKFYQLVQTYTLNKGIKKFGIEGKRAAYKEMQQLHDRVVFKPVRVESLTPLERQRAMESLIFLTEKRDKRIKARMCANGSTQRAYTPKEEATSPTAATESILLTGVIEAKQNRDIMTLDVPNAFVQTNIPQGKDDEKVIMKIRGQLVDLLVELSPETYADFIVYEGKSKVLYVKMLKALYGMIKASVLYYKKFRTDIESIGYEVNPYDPCVANKMISGKQHTLTWHVDDVKSSHVDPKVNDAFHAWCEKMYGNKDIGHVTAVRGKVHDYLAMNLDYSTKDKLKVDMKYYITNMLEEFPFKVKKQSKTPWNDKLFKVNESVKNLDEERKSVFHTFVMKAMFLCKRARPDIEPAVSYLSTRTSKPNESDWLKLLRMMSFLKGTRDDVLTLEVSDLQVLFWYVDAAFAVHQDMKSHTGIIFTLGKGAIISGSTKQKVNSRSSTEAELNAVDEKLSKIIRTKKFLESQGFKIKLNIIFQDNTSTIKLQENGKVSSGKRTRHFDIKLFYVTDLISRDEVTVKYCPSDKMIADYMSKPLMGAKFKEFRNLIMNLDTIN